MQHATIIGYNKLLADLGVPPASLEVPTLQAALQAGLVTAIGKHAAVTLSGVSDMQHTTEHSSAALVNQGNVASLSGGRNDF